MKKSQTLKRLVYEIFCSPLLPLLFLQESVKYTIEGSHELAAIHFGLFVISSVVWAAADSIDIEFKTENFIGE